MKTLNVLPRIHDMGRFKELLLFRASIKYCGGLLCDCRDICDLDRVESELTEGECALVFDVD